MEELLQKLHDYSRQLELEDNLTCWENQSMEIKARISEMTDNLRKKEQALAGLETPTFFQKLFGKTESEKAKYGRQIREITSARMAAQWEQEALEKKISSGQQELESLSGSRAAYEAAKAEWTFTSAQESRIMMEEITAFAPAALEAAGRNLESLEMAELQRNQEDAEAAARRLLDILLLLPEGAAPVGNFLRTPRDYLQDDKGLCQAREQIQQVINQLRLLLGE